MLLLYILWDDWPIFRISGSKEQLQQQLEYTLLKPDCHSWWISKIQSGREDTLEEWYTIKFCFKLGKNATEIYGMLQTAFHHLAWIEHQFSKFLCITKLGRSKFHIHITKSTSSITKQNFNRYNVVFRQRGQMHQLQLLGKVTYVPCFICIMSQVLGKVTVLKIDTRLQSDVNS